MKAAGSAFARPYVDALFEVAGSPDAVESLLPPLDAVARALETVRGAPRRPREPRGRPEGEARPRRLRSPSRGERPELAGRLLRALLDSGRLLKLARRPRGDPRAARRRARRRRGDRPAPPAPLAAGRRGGDPRRARGAHRDARPPPHRTRPLAPVGLRRPARERGLRRLPFAPPRRGRERPWRAPPGPRDPVIDRRQGKETLP